MNKAENILLIILCFAITTITVILTQTNYKYYGATKSYRVYLEGKSLGLINSKEDLEKYIDQKQQNIKTKYNVKNVYIPNGLEIKEETTYNQKISSTEEIYKEIEKNQSFSIEGYKVTIDKTSKQESEEDESIKEVTNQIVVYILDKEILTNAINELVVSFIDKEEYEDYLNENQQQIDDEGTIIENVYIKEQIKIKKDYISTSETIFTNSKDLAEYLLYGSQNTKKTYTVQEGDTIASISEKNEISSNIFLIINKDITSENALLYTGQKVLVNKVSPIITVVEEVHSVANEDVKYQTVTQEDKNYVKGYTKVIQEGINGKSIVTRKIKKENGQITDAVIIESIVLKEAQNKIVKVGARTEYLVANTKYWAWPLNSAYTVSDNYGYRLHPIYNVVRMHNGVDLSTRCGTPVYAANDGTVTTSTYHYSFGYYIDINHNNGYVTRYAHLQTLIAEQGEAVHMGQLIGKVGSTGDSTGCHLHYEVMKNGSLMNPYLLYQWK